jgi:hypothetical protein
MSTRLNTPCDFFGKIGEPGRAEGIKSVRFIGNVSGGFGLCRPMFQIELMQVVDGQRLFQCVSLKPLRLWRAWARSSEDPEGRLPIRLRWVRRSCLVLPKADLRPNCAKSKKQLALIGRRRYIARPFDKKGRKSLCDVPKALRPGKQ